MEQQYDATRLSGLCPWVGRMLSVIWRVSLKTEYAWIHRGGVCGMLCRGKPIIQGTTWANVSLGSPMVGKG